MNRTEAKKQIDLMRISQLEKVKKIVHNRHIHGEYVTINIGNEKIHMLHYPSKQNNPPVYFDIHGGGFAWGMIEEGDLLCHHINEQLDFEVYSLDYPLVPATEYPYSLNWLYKVINHIRLNPDEFNINPYKMVVGGRSAGGNLSAALCLLAKEKNEFQFSCQVLDHPYLDLCGLTSDNDRYSGSEALKPELMELLATAYATPQQRKEIFCSPLNATIEELTGIAPAIIQTCELDSLRPDGDKYAAKLQKAKVPVIHQCYPHVPHGFTENEGSEELNGQQFLIDGIKQFTL